MMKRKGFFESRKGISVMVGYVLLVVFLIIIGGIVYQWLKTYIPKQALECPDGTSLFIKEASFNSDNSRLIVTLRNNGRFDLAGYFIYVTNSSDQELPIIDLSGYLNEAQGPGTIFGTSVLFFEGGSNLFSPGSEDTYFFDIPSSIGVPYALRIIPTRFQEVEGKSRFSSCGNARVEQLVGEPYVCVPNTCANLIYVCGTWGDGCGATLNCGTCTSPDVCNGAGQCVAPGECTDTCGTYGYECGTWEICGVSTDCGNCTILYGSGYACDTMGQCELLCGNSVLDDGEKCDDGNNIDGDGCSSICIIESGFTCSGEPSICEAISSCPSYCVYLGYGAGGYCTNSEGNCVSGGGVYESGGDQWCAGGSQADTCCCTLIDIVY